MKVDSKNGGSSRYAGRSSHGGRGGCGGRGGHGGRTRSNSCSARREVPKEAINIMVGDSYNVPKVDYCPLRTMFPWTK